MSSSDEMTEYANEKKTVEFRRLEAMMILTILNEAIKEHGTPPDDLGKVIANITLNLDNAFDFGLREAALVAGEG